MRKNHGTELNWLSETLLLQAFVATKHFLGHNQENLDSSWSKILSFDTFIDAVKSNINNIFQDGCPGLFPLFFWLLTDHFLNLVSEGSWDNSNKILVELAIWEGSVANCAEKAAGYQT